MILKYGSISRGAGFCLNRECTDFHKDVFLMDHAGAFKCPRCRILGRKVMDYGETDNDFSMDFWQVRIEYSYDVVANTFRDVAIVSDETMNKEGNIFTLKTPLFKTEKRALLTAEALLGTLMRADESIFAKGYIPKDQIFNIDFDKPLAEVKGKLEEIGAILQQSRLRK